MKWRAPHNPAMARERGSSLFGDIFGSTVGAIAFGLAVTGLSIGSREDA
jgi:hypothetical protein